MVALATSPDGRLLAAGADSGEVYLWRCRDFKRLFTLRGHGDWVRSVAFSPDGALLASASSDKTIRLWDTTTGSCLRSLMGHENRVRGRFQPGREPVGQRLQRRDRAPVARRGWPALRTLHGHTEVVWTARFDAAGRRLASSSYDQTIRLWDVETGACLRVLTGHEDVVLALAFHPTRAPAGQRQR
ncbi:MAG: WD40 repeat domain-containing protein [Anaerolineae bacterium]|nr:MAG: WD40 repeat domain-containing protein [Anaerolineae bacterium]